MRTASGSFIARLGRVHLTAAGDGTTVEMLFPLPRSKARAAARGRDALLYGRARVLRHA
jgi:hypothetical protein